ncbi:MAG: STAS domain-containing protein [Alphaproteobacteria bacterium]
MTCEAQEKNGATVVSLSGEIDLQTSPDVRRFLLKSLSQGKSLVVDMSAVGYIDSSGIASLVEAYQTARKMGLRFALAQVGPSAMRVFQLARLDRVFTIFPSVDAALQDHA